MTKMEPYTDYKDSGVEWLGYIPVEWGAHRIKMSVQSARNGIWGQDPQEDSPSVWCVRVADFDRKSQTVESSTRTMRSITSDELAPRRLSRGNLLLEKSGGGENNPVGFVVRYDYDEVAVCSNFVAKVQLRPGMDPRFWTYVHATTYSVRLTQRSIKQTSGIQNLDQASYFNEIAPFPPLDTQTQIADFLDRETAQIDDLIGKQERLIEVLAEKRQSVITQAVTKGLDSVAPTKPSGVPWLGSIPAHWKASRLKFALKRIEQGVSPQADAIPASPDSWGVLKSGCVNGGIFKEHENKQLPIEFAIDPGIVVAVGDLLVSRASGSPKLVGSAARIRSLESKLILSDKTFRFVTGQDIDADFLEWVLNSQPYRKQVEASISGAEGLANNISTTALKNIAFALPPRSEQLTISEELRHRVDALFSLESKSTRAVQLLRERRSALITAAVTGRLDYDLD